jgi:hypothetical protein
LSSAGSSINHAYFSNKSSYVKNTIRIPTDNGFNMTMQGGSIVTTRISNAKTPVSYLQALDKGINNETLSRPKIKKFIPNKSYKKSTMYNGFF